MPYRYLDDNAWTSVDDGADASAMLRIAARDARMVHSTRLPSGGWTATQVPGGASRPIYLCSAWPACLVAGVMALPTGEDWRSVVLRVEYEAVTLDVIPGVRNAVRLYATVAPLWPQSGDPVLPPLEVTAWTTLAETAVQARVELTATIPPYLRSERWLSVLLWVQSIASDVSEGSGTIGLVESTGAVRLTVTAGVAPPVSATPARLIVVSQDLTGKGYGSQHSGYTHQLMRFGAAPAANTAFLAPSAIYWSTYSGAAGATLVSWTSYPLGQIEVVGLCAELAAPQWPAPVEEAYRTNQPLADYLSMGLVDRVAQMSEERLPQWLAGPAVDVNLSTARPWPMRFHPTLAPRALDGTWRQLCMAPVADPPPDRAGHEAVVLLALYASQWQVWDSWRLDVRLAAYAAPGALGAPLASTPAADQPRVQSGPITRWTGLLDEEYSALGHMMWAVPDWGGWQFRGLLHFRGLEPIRPEAHQYRELIAVRVTLPEAGLTYPCRLAVEAQLAWVGAGVGLLPTVTSAVVAYGIAPRELG